MNWYRLASIDFIDLHVKFNWNSLIFDWSKQKQPFLNEKKRKHFESEMKRKKNYGLFNKFGARLQLPLLMIGIESMFLIAFFRSFLSPSPQHTLCTSHTYTHTAYAINIIDIKCAKFLRSTPPHSVVWIYYWNKHMELATYIKYTLFLSFLFWLLLLWASKMIESICVGWTNSFEKNSISTIIMRMMNCIEIDRPDRGQEMGYQANEKWMYTMILTAEY